MTDTPTIENSIASPSSAQPTLVEGDTKPTRGRFAIIGLITVFVTQLMLVVDASIVNVALPDIKLALHFSTAGLSWAVTAYALAFAGLMLLSGKVGSIIGAKRALIIGTLIFIVASAAGGLAPTAEVLVIARVVQGVGAALAAPSTLVLLAANTTPGPQRQRALALFVLAAGSGGAIGLILGGILTTGFGWEWVMFVNVPIGILIVLGAAFFLGETEKEPSRLDFGGAAASTIAMVALVYGFTTAASDGWANPLVIGSFVVAVLSGIALFLIERRHSSPVVELSLFSTPRRAIPFVAMLLVPAALFAFFYFVTLFTQDVFHYSALGTGLALLPFVISMLIVNQTSPRFLPRFGERLAGIVGLVLMGGGLLWLAQINPQSTFVSGILGPLIVLGVGAGLTFAPITAVVMHHAPDEHMSAASSLLQAMQQLGGSVGVAALTSVFITTAAVSGLAHGISTAILAGVGFVIVALALFAIWGSRIPVDAERGEAAPVGH